MGFAWSVGPPGNIWSPCNNNICQTITGVNSNGAEFLGYNGNVLIIGPLGIQQFQCPP